jgi:hypothetical protein
MYELACGGTFSQLLREVDLLTFTAVVLGCLIGLFGVVGGITAAILKTRAREQTRRELAAYVAEGTLDPDKAVAMLNAGMPKWAMPDLGKMTGGKT